MDAGPLAEADTNPVGTSQDKAERCPTLTVAPDGSLFIAFLIWRRDQVGGELQIAPLHIDTPTGKPSFPPAVAQCPGTRMPLRGSCVLIRRPVAVVLGPGKRIVRIGLACRPRLRPAIELVLHRPRKSEFPDFARISKSACCHGRVAREAARASRSV